MNEEYLKRLIHEYNPQLIGKKLEAPVFKRDLYFELLKWFKKDQIIAIAGLRRVGKTTLMKQLMQEADSPVFFSFDEEDTQSKEALLFVIDFFINNSKSKFIFLDEIQYIRDWQGVLKRYYDTKKIKFVVSGSESLELKKAKESLAGRIATFMLAPLSFKEYIELRGKKIYSFQYEKLLPEKEFFESEFISYLHRGGFPELVNEDDNEIVRKYISELVVKKIIFSDIQRIFEIRKVNILSELFRYICNHSSDMFEIKNLCSVLKADYETVSNYLFFLHEAFLTKTSEVFSKNISKRIRKSKKIYIVHPSIAFAVLGYTKEMLIEKILGQYVESLFGGGFFWRDERKNEVDLVLDGKPVEIKFRNEISKSDLKGLVKFMEAFDSKEGIVVTKNIYKEENFDGRKILFFPAWFFALSR